MSQSNQRPKIVELKPGIFQLRAERPGSHVYLIKGSNKNVLIDTGTSSNYPNLTRGLEELGLKPSHIHLIILTHEHFDHTGACSHFFETAVIAAHPLAANKISLQDEFVMMSRYLDAASKPFRADIWLHDNSVIDLGNYRIRVMHTPGHCSGCVCLYEPSMRVLFTGDTVLAAGVLPGILGSGNVSDYIVSLQRLKAIKIDEIFPGHGKISKTPDEDLSKALEYSQGLLEESKALFEVLDTRKTYERYFLDLQKRPPTGPVE